MSEISRISRRHFLKNTATASALGVAGYWPIGDLQAVENLVVGFIYAGPRNDFGYNQAHAKGADALKNMPGVIVIEEENISETEEVEESLETEINLDGAALLLTTAYRYYDPYVVNMAKKYPRRQFRHCGNVWQENQHPENTGSYYAYIDEGQYLNGIAAACSSRSLKLGFVAAKPMPHVLRNINAFTLGARSINPAITTEVVFTGKWHSPNDEVEATNHLIDQGVDVITHHVDSPKAIFATTENRKIYCCGYHIDQSLLAPKGYLTGAEWRWETAYRNMVTAVQDNENIPNCIRGGLREGFVKMSPYGEALSDNAIRAVETAKIAMLKGDTVIFKGPLNDNKGGEIITAGRRFERYHTVLEQMDWFVEGVIV